MGSNSQNVNVSHWELAIQGTVHAPIAANIEVGTEKLSFRPSVGLNFRLGYRIAEIQKTEEYIFVSRGCTPYWCSIAVFPDKYAQLRSEWVTDFYVAQHPYFDIGGYMKFSLFTTGKAAVFLGNRFYASASTSVSVVSYDANTMKEMVVFEAVTGTDSHFFCPELSFSYSAPFLTRYPSWDYEIMAAIAPVSVIKGGYTFFPDYSNGSLGYFKLQQSFLGLGIKYQRVKQESK